MKNESKLPYQFRSIWFWWFIVTIFYLIIAAITLLTSEALSSSPIVERLVWAIGVFVPHGFSTAIMLFDQPQSRILALVSIAVFFIGMFFANKYLKSKQLSDRKLIAYIFVTLLLITMAVDISKGAPFFSWQLLIFGLERVMGI